MDATKSSKYEIRPPRDQKFHGQIVKECMREVLLDELTDKSYHPQNVPKWTSDIAKALCSKVKGAIESNVHFTFNARMTVKKDCVHMQRVSICRGCPYAEGCIEMKFLAEELGYKRYKLVAQVTIGEQRGAGVKISSSCLWDADTDSHATEILSTDTLFCVATVYGIYYY